VVGEPKPSAWQQCIVCALKLLDISVINSRIFERQYVWVRNKQEGQKYMKLVYKKVDFTL
jgi:hypothetical protein